jgi:F-type H+-transporting ATPase subunit a
VADSHSPLTQFAVQPLFELPALFGANIAFTNSALFMLLAVAASWAFFAVGMRRKALVPGRLQVMAEGTYRFVANTVRDNAGEGSEKFFPLIFSLFLFVLFCNLLGLLPYAFTVTSHIIVTFALAIMVFLTVSLVAIIQHGPLTFLGSFLPKGTPWWMAPIMYLIELFSYLSRPVSLSVRLAANMIAGHTMLKVIAGFVVMLGAAGIAPLLLLVILNGFEIFVAILQAYIFTVLTCVYLHSALHLH